MQLAYIGLGLIVVSLFLPWLGPQTLVDQVFSFNLDRLTRNLISLVLIFSIILALGYERLKNNKSGQIFSFLLLIVGSAFLALNFFIRCQEITCSFSDLGFGLVAAFLGLALYNVSYRIKH